MTPGATDASRPVIRLVQPMVLAASAMIGLLALIAVLGVLVSSRSVDHLTQRLQPAAAANSDVLRDMLNMETGVRAWINVGERSALEPYRLGMSRIARDEAAVRAYAADDPELLALVRRQERAAAAWRQQYGEPRVEDSRGRGTIPPALFERGKSLFDDFRAAQRRTAEAFDGRLRDASSAAEWQLKGTLIGVILVGLVGGIVLARARRRLLEQVSDPLVAMETAVKRIAADPTTRVEERGPTEVREVAQALNELAADQERARAVEEQIQQELRVLDTARADFVANVSHELRTPLTTLNGYLELAADEFEGAMSPQHERMVDAARRNVSRLRLLIDDLLTLSKAESTSTSLERLDLSPLLQDVVSDVRLTATRRGVSIEHERSRQPALVLADKVMIYRALLNVLSNAVKFSPEGSGVEVRLLREPDSYVIEVRDHGIGIPADELEQLGTRFFRASNAVSGEIAGTGLGVRIVQTIVEKHAGQLSIDSIEGEGTTVAIRLPRQADQGPAGTEPDDETVGQSS